jgi:hypothetical protein
MVEQPVCIVADFRTEWIVSVTEDGTLCFKAASVNCGHAMIEIPKTVLSPGVIIQAFVVDPSKWGLVEAKLALDVMNIDKPHSPSLVGPLFCKIWNCDQPERICDEIHKMNYNTTILKQAKYRLKTSPKSDGIEADDEVAFSLLPKSMSDK